MRKMSFEALRALNFQRFPNDQPYEMILILQYNDQISCILFGGMYELKHKMNTRSAKNKPEQAKPIIKQKQQINTKNKQKSQGQKRPPQQKSLLQMFKIQKQDAHIIPEPAQIKYTIKQVLKHTSISQILTNCPKVKQLYQLLSTKSFANEKVIFFCFDKYFHGNTTSLWINKYAPRDFNELFQTNFARKIQQWIKNFYYSKNSQVNPDSDFDFIDDSYESSCSKSLQLRKKQYGWNCKGLVLRGRNGVGKTALLTAIAKSLNIKWFQYACDVDQYQKMKELVDGSQSQVVTNYPSKKQEQQNKILKQNSLLTKFIPQNPSKLQQIETKQPKRLQIFRNFTEYYPISEKMQKETAEDNYYRFLLNEIYKSPIPYILTTDKMEYVVREKNSKQKLANLDYIQFTENSVDDLTYLYWLIYQIENNLHFDNRKKIRKESIFEEINDQFKDINFCVDQNTHLIRQLVIAANKKPHYIAKYLQFQVFLKAKNSHSTFTQTGQEAMVKLLETSIEKVAKQVAKSIDSQGLINNIEWSLCQKSIEQPNPLQQTAAEQIDRQEKEKSFQIAEKENKKKPTLKQIRQKLTFRVSQDKKVFEDQFFQGRQQIEQQQTDYLNIPTHIHSETRRKLFNSIRTKINGSGERKQVKRSLQGLSPKNMFYFPLMFPEKRVSRLLKKQASLEENFSKMLNHKQLSYIKKFSKFILFFESER